MPDSFDAYLHGGRLRHAQQPRGRRPVVGPQPRPRPDRRPAGAARAGQRRPVPGDHGQADARRRVRDVHRRDVRRRTWTGTGIPTDHQGRLFIDPETLREAAGRLGAAGFQLHFHAIGDLAVSTALDVIEALPAAQRQAARHHLAHLQFITPRDMGRFAALGAVANFQPLWAMRGNADGGADPPVRRRRSAPPGSTRSARWSGRGRGSRSAATGRCRAPIRCRRSTSR